MKVKVKKTTIREAFQRKKRQCIIQNAIFAILAIIACCGIAIDAAICFKIFCSDYPFETLKDSMKTILAIAIPTAISGTFCSNFIQRMEKEV
jgi:hypothetical protein